MKVTRVMAPRRFTGKEDMALVRIIASLQERNVRVRWADVVAQLQELGFPERSQKSVRNRHLRRRQALTEKDQGILGKNLCRICGRLQKGHVCQVADTVAEPEDCVPDPS
tara:strand:- start:912 stop:1241 length:330 start_codon:yes stop_codon:yes gene_type:complete